jgi:hypothetical protein
MLEKPFLPKANRAGETPSPTRERARGRAPRRIPQHAAFPSAGSHGKLANIIFWLARDIINQI